MLVGWANWKTNEEQVQRPIIGGCGLNFWQLKNPPHFAAYFFDIRKICVILHSQFPVQRHNQVRAFFKNNFLKLIFTSFFLQKLNDILRLLSFFYETFLCIFQAKKNWSKTMMTKKNHVHYIIMTTKNDLGEANNKVLNWNWKN